MSHIDELFSRVGENGTNPAIDALDSRQDYLPRYNSMGLIGSLALLITSDDAAAIRLQKDFDGWRARRRAAKEQKRAARREESQMPAFDELFDANSEYEADVSPKNHRGRRALGNLVTARAVDLPAIRSDRSNAAFMRAAAARARQELERSDEGSTAEMPFVKPPNEHADHYGKHAAHNTNDETRQLEKVE